MGKTVLPYSWVIEGQQKRFLEFRRALRREDQAHFDALFDHARYFMPAGVQQSHPEPFQPLVLSILLRQEKEIAALRRQLRELRSAEPGRAGKP